LGGPGIASPTNLAGETGTVNVGSFAIFNPQDNTIFLPEVDRGEQGLQAAQFEVDLENLLFYFQYGAPLRSKTLLSDDAATFMFGDGIYQYYVPKLLVGDMFYEITFDWINELNAYGNIQVLSQTSR
jgi:hypothetical protein